jgi:hypothetical protein
MGDSASKSGLRQKAMARFHRPPNRTEGKEEEVVGHDEAFAGLQV